MKKILFFTLCLAAAGFGIAMEPGQDAPLNPATSIVILRYRTVHKRLVVLLSKVPKEGALNKDQQADLFKVSNDAQVTIDAINEMLKNYPTLNKEKFEFLIQAFTEFISEATELYNKAMKQSSAAVGDISIEDTEQANG